MKKILLIIAGVLVVLITTVLLKTCFIKSKQITDVTEVEINLDEAKIASNLSKALTYKTISYTDPEEFDYNEFTKLHKYIDDTYELVKKNLTKKVINNYSLLYKWQGSDESLKPIILCAHMDVVGVEDSTEKWKHEPFSGDIADGKIWGERS